MTRAAALLLVLVVAGCRAGAPATEIVVVVRTDVSSPPLASVRLTVGRAGSDGGTALFSTCACTGHGAGCAPFPLTLGLAPEGMPDGPFTVRAAGFSNPRCDGDSVVETSATVAFVPTLAVELDLELAVSCEGVSCAEGTTCDGADQLCVSDDRRGKLPPFTAFDGFAPLDFASVTDGGASDLAVPDLPSSDLSSGDLATPDGASIDGGASAMIISVAPSSGPDKGGIPLSIFGARFVAPVKVRVDGILAAGVTLVSPGRIDATLPPEPGACARVAVVVQNGDGQMLTAPTPFTYVCAGGMLVGLPAIATSLAAPNSLATADVNGDHRPDLIIPDALHPTLAVLLNQGAFAFAAPALTKTSTPAFALAMADFNEDGLLDVALPEAGGNGVAVLAGKGGGGFADAVVTGGLPTNPTAIAVANFDGDAHLDVALVGPGANLASLLFGFGNLKFKAPIDFVTGAHPIALAVGDFDGNASPDLVIANRDDATLTVVLDAGAAPKSSTWKLPLHPTAVAIADIDGDHAADVLVTTADGNFLLVLAGKGDGSFFAPTEIAAVASTALAVVDVNGDGHLDLALADFAGGKLDLLLGQGQRAFAAPTPFPVGVDPRAVVTLDVDGDGRPDFAVINAGSADISLLRNNTP